MILHTDTTGTPQCLMNAIRTVTENAAVKALLIVSADDNGFPRPIAHGCHSASLWRNISKNHLWQKEIG